FLPLDIVEVAAAGGRPEVIAAGEAFDRSGAAVETLLPDVRQITDETSGDWDGDGRGALVYWVQDGPPVAGGRVLPLRPGATGVEGVRGRAEGGDALGGDVSNAAGEPAASRPGRPARGGRRRRRRDDSAPRRGAAPRHRRGRAGGRGDPPRRRLGGDLLLER